MPAPLTEEGPEGRTILELARTPSLRACEGVRLRLSAARSHIVVSAELGRQDEDVGSPAEFYDDLSTRYHHLYPNWQVAIDEQGRALDEVLARSQGRGPHRILDAAAGIGTQLLGLAAHGHRLCGSDVSPGAIRRARVETTARGVTAAFAVADIRALPYADGRFDAVVCADNAVAHLLSPQDLTAALDEFRRVIRPGGHVLVSTRDYEQARHLHPTGTSPQVSRDGKSLVVTFQVWDWCPDGKRYDLRHFQLVQDRSGWTVTQRTSRLWAVTRRELGTCAERAGLDDVHWLLPDHSRFFQPLLLARVP